MGFEHFQVFVDEASREKQVVGLTSRDAVVDDTVQYVANMARDGVA